MELGTPLRIALSTRRIWAMVCLLGSLIFCAVIVWKGEDTGVAEASWLVPLGNVGLTLAGVGLGLVLAPSPRPVIMTN